MRTHIYLDMDDTLNDMSSVPDWQHRLNVDFDMTVFNEFTFRQPEPIIKSLIRNIHDLGGVLHIRSWGPYGTEFEYGDEGQELLEAAIEQKTLWLKRHYLYDLMTSIEITPYGTPKQPYTDSGEFDLHYLLDDNPSICEAWWGHGFRHCAFNVAFDIVGDLMGIYNALLNKEE